MLDFALLGQRLPRTRTVIVKHRSSTARNAIASLRVSCSAGVYWWFWGAAVTPSQLSPLKWQVASAGRNLQTPKHPVSTKNASVHCLFAQKRSMRPDKGVRPLLQKALRI